MELVEIATRDYDNLVVEIEAKQEELRALMTKLRPLKTLLEDLKILEKKKRVKKE